MEFARAVREGMSRYVGMGRLGLGFEGVLLLLLLLLLSLLLLLLGVVVGFGGVERIVQELRLRKGRTLKVFDGGEVDVELVVGLELDAVAVGAEDDEGGMERTMRLVIGSAV